MSKKNKAPKEPKEPTMVKPFDEDVKKAISIFLILLIIFCLGNFTGSIISSNKTIKTEGEPSQAATTSTAPATTTTTPATTTTTPPVSEPSNPTEPPVSSNDAAATSGNAGSETQPAQPSGAPTTKAEIIALFNESANKIKTNATGVTRNYEDLQHNEEFTEMPSVAETVGKPLISRFLKKDETPVNYAGADITANYPVKGESFVSKATEADVLEATCTDDGTNYNIVLKFNESTDPATGTGCASAFNVMKSEEIVEGSGNIVTQSSTRYYDAVIECKIDKATGNMTWANYKLPMVLSVTAKIVFAQVDAKIGMTFIDDYTITY